MESDLLNISRQIYDMALRELDEKKVLEAYSLFEMAFSSAFMAKSTIPISFKLIPRTYLPCSIDSIDHVIVHLSKENIVFFAAADIITSPSFSFERFPIVGDLFSRVAMKLPETGVFECIIDLSDGDDRGHYQRISYSSSHPETVLIPDPVFYGNDNFDIYRAYAAENAKPWRDRRNVIFWRGGSGGPRVNSPDPQDPLNWSCQQRLQLCAASRKSRHPHMLDVALVHLKTIPEAYLRDAIEREGFLKQEVPKLEFLGYKYLIDVDGWTNAWSLLDKMIGGAAILKIQSAFGFRQWFYDKLIPWENFIPLASDVSDLDDIITWIISHPMECEKIADAAASLAKDIQLLPALAEAETAVLGILRPVKLSE